MHFVLKTVERTFTVILFLDNYVPLRLGNLVRHFMYLHYMFCHSILEVTSLFTVKFLCPIVDRKTQVLLYFTLCCTTVKFSQCVQTARYFSAMVCDLRLAGIPRVAVHQPLGRGPVVPPTSCAQTLNETTRP